MFFNLDPAIYETIIGVLGVVVLVAIINLVRASRDLHDARTALAEAWEGESRASHAAELARQSVRRATRTVLDISMKAAAEIDKQRRDGRKAWLLADKIINALARELAAAKGITVDDILFGGSPFDPRTGMDRGATVLPAGTEAVFRADRDGNLRQVGGDPEFGKLINKLLGGRAPDQFHIAALDKIGIDAADITGTAEGRSALRDALHAEHEAKAQGGETGLASGENGNQGTAQDEVLAAVLDEGNVTQADLDAATDLQPLGDSRRVQETGHDPDLADIGAKQDADPRSPGKADPRFEVKHFGEYSSPSPRAG